MTELEAERTRLAARLAHRLESSLLLVREAAERGDDELLFPQLDELGRRARGLARCCAVGPDALTALHDAVADWMGADGRIGHAGGVLQAEAGLARVEPEAAELGEPLIRLLAAEAGGELIEWTADKAVLRVPDGPR